MGEKYNESIIIAYDKESYINFWHEFEDKKINKVPVYLHNRIDLEEKLGDICKLYSFGREIKKMDYGIDLSNINGFFEVLKRTVAYKWININDVLVSNDKIESIVVFGVYDDFKYDEINKLINYCIFNRIKIYFLIGRDISSLSWIVAKQFLKWKEVNSESAIFTYKRIGNTDDFRKISEESRWNIYDLNDMKRLNIKQEILDKVWDRIMFHGHGKEDHLNMDEYTLCGLNTSVKKMNITAPSCGHCEQTCFKDRTKLVDANCVKVKDMYLLSCCNFPFNDLRLYDKKYNLGLNAIDGLAQKLYLSVTVQNSDLEDIKLFFQCCDSNVYVPYFFNRIMRKKFNYSFMIEIGLPSINEEITVECEKVEKCELNQELIDIINRMYFYSRTSLINNDSVFKKKINNALLKIENAFSKEPIEKHRKLMGELLNKANAFGIEMVNLMSESNENDLYDFYDYNIERSEIYKINRDAVCSCGIQSIETMYKSKIKGTLDVISNTCYRCGDQFCSMENMPYVKLKIDSIIKVGEKIKLTLDISPKQNGTIYISNILPGYIQKYRRSKTNIKTIRNAKNNIIYHCEDEIELDEKIPCQSYYITVIVIQNIGISIYRTNFNIIKGV